MMMNFKTLDDIIKTASTLVLKHGISQGGNRQSIPQPVMMTLGNPLLRYPCIHGMKRLVAKSIAESIYALSGMNGSDFIWEFRGWADPRSMTRIDDESIGQPLRFWYEKTGKVLNYSNSNYLREQGTGYIDQFQKAFTHLINSDDSFVFSFREPCRIGGRLHSAWVRRGDDGRLNMMVSCGEINVIEELIVKIIPSFSFILQMLSEVTKNPIGSLTISIAVLYCHLEDTLRLKELSKTRLPFVGGLNNFQYPTANLTLRDIDTLISMMQEFVGRLNEKSLERTNPYVGDARVIAWSDMAEVFRANKANELGYKIENDLIFYHPQLRYIYKGVSI
jgi:hypothetical protein